jgi:hypothetical protein
MIKYALICEARHEFESWFSDSQAFETQALRGLVECPHCGSTQVEKALMAPSVSTSKRKARNSLAQMADAHASAPETGAPPTQAMALLDEKQRAVRNMLREMHRKITETTVDVGAGFVDEARRMHDGETPARAIRGEASFEQAKELWEEGVPVMPIPALPDDRN